MVLSVLQVDLGILGRELPGTDQVVPAFQSRYLSDISKWYPLQDLYYITTYYFEIKISVRAIDN